LIPHDYLSGPMSRAVTITLGCAFIGLAAPASAQQEMYPGQNVVVNSQATGTQVLLYPDGTHSRVVTPLLQPGQNPSQIIHLHMPVKHRVVHRVRKPVTDVATVDVPGYNVPPETSVAELPPAPKPVAPRPVAPRPTPEKLAAKPAAQKPAPKPTASASTSGAALPFSFDPRTTDYSATPPEPAKNTRLAAAPPPPVKVPPSGDNGLTRRSQIIFAAGVADPAANALDAIRMLGGDLNASLNGGASRIQLQAYGGAMNDKSSDARRLSLKRALAIRQILIDAGVPSGKIDVRAMGGADNGPPDRVDVFLRG
jgi:outer membrane protein OmpA-like peptidoglycan-associated protein